MLCTCNTLLTISIHHPTPRENNKLQLEKAEQCSNIVEVQHFCSEINLRWSAIQNKYDLDAKCGILREKNCELLI